jgi:hypothetical protein
MTVSRESVDETEIRRDLSKVGASVVSSDFFGIHSIYFAHQCFVKFGSDSPIHQQYPWRRRCPRRCEWSKYGIGMVFGQVNCKVPSPD